jgi:hypothetical protein
VASRVLDDHVRQVLHEGEAIRVVLTVLGVVGLALLGSAATWVPFVSGVLSGVTLLGGSLYGVRRA